MDKLIACYKLWHDFLPHIPHSARYTIGVKIDVLFLAAVELMFIAGHAPKPARTAYLQKAIVKFDILKLFLRIIWEIKALDNKKYTLLSETLFEIGKMLGGWYRQASKENPAPSSAGSK